MNARDMKRTPRVEEQGWLPLRALRRGLSLDCTALFGLCLLALLLSASPAIAGSVSNERPLLFSFDGGDSSIGPFTAPLAAAGDESSGDVYVINAAGSGKGPGPFDHERVICKFNDEGKAQVFSASGKSCFDGSETPGGAFGIEGSFREGASLSDIAIDNSGGAGKAGEGEQGRIYVSEEGGPVHAFAPDGTWLRTLTLPSCGITVDSKGNLLVGTNSNKVIVFDADGNLIEEIPITNFNGSRNACRLARAHNGKDLYVGLELSGVDKYVEGVYDSTLTSETVFDVTINQSEQAGHIFTLTPTDFAEYEPCEALHCAGNEVEGSPFGGDLIGNPRGIAYNPKEDWVYISDRASRTVKIFGPKASGTVPDATCQTTEPVGLRSATAHCTINALALPNSYHFEWKEGTGENWGAARSSSPQSISPTDGSPHLVSFEITKLKSNSPYQVRLVGTNAENGLSAYSAPDTFSTKVPPPPIVECAEISVVTTNSAHLACSIDTREEETTWRVEESIDPACGKGFSVAYEQTIPEGEPVPVDIERDLEGLLPAQHYCVRVTAQGPAEPGSDLVELSTKAIPPSEASLAFTAPRTDTTARINARANPNGQAAITGGLNYQFELSEDGGASWTLLALRKSMVDARQPVVLGEDLEGLSPGTTYLYRLKLVENKVGSIVPPSEAKAFTTRTSAEMTLPPNTFGEPKRGIELVNEPDKGTQNASAFGPVVGSSPLSADGDEVLWFVTGGAPGASNGTSNTFLAKRTGKGWESQSIAPLAAEQLGGGELAYKLSATSADFGTYIFNAKRSTGLSAPEPPTFVRVKPGQEEEILKGYELQPPSPSYESLLDLTDDTRHVVFPDNKTFQLEDIGSQEAPEVISRMPDDSLSSCGLDLTNAQDFASNFIWHPGYHWIATTDASRVYFQVRANGECGKAKGEPAGLSGLYVRNREAGKTTLIDPGSAGQSPQFIRATPDGRQAYFLTYSSCRRYTQLGSPPGCELPEAADANGHADVYRWEESEGKSVCLTCVAPDASVGPRVLVSNDFSHLYFESEKQLVPDQGKAGDHNIYLLNGGEIQFVADTSGESALDRGGDPALTSNGNVLMFGAPASPGLTADAVGPQCIQPISQDVGKCSEFYRYDARDESLECLSCLQGGVTTHSAGTTAGASGIHFKLSDDGTTAAFVTQQALLPLDVNQDTDIYEWRNGALRLITDGVSDFQTNFTAPQVLAVDRDGSGILFGLVPPGGSLTGFERDQLLNVYEARIGGGFVPPSPRTICIEDSCQGPLQSPPHVNPSASSGFHGNGNLNKGGSKPCPKGKVRRSGRCVKKHAAKGQKHKRKQHPRSTPASGRGGR